MEEHQIYKKTRNTKIHNKTPDNRYKNERKCENKMSALTFVQQVSLLSRKCGIETHPDATTGCLLEG
jgi:hypothetical protein